MRGVFARVAHHLLTVRLAIVYRYISRGAFGIGYERHARIDESLVRSYAKGTVALKQLFVQTGVDTYGVLLYKSLGSLVVALALYALYLAEQGCKSVAQTAVVGNLHTGLAFLLHELYGIGIMSQCPSGYEGTVAHVCLFYLMAGLDACELCEQTVHHVRIVLGTMSLDIGGESELHELGVGYVVESEEVGTCLLYCRTV